jgi:hypothetical protein
MKHRSAAALALALAHDLDDDLDRARARDLDLELDRDLAHALDSADALARALAEGCALNDALTLTGALACDLARARSLACSRPRARNLVCALDHARSRAHVLERVLYTAMWAEVRSRSILGRVPRELIALVVRILPEHDRQRVWEELCAELAGLPHRKRLWYALGVLASAWELRCALIETVRTPDGAPVRRAKR